MKIKELHLRNIASIEKADIDFEKGLNDGVTGTPASVFLICGDTGAGKTVNHPPHQRRLRQEKQQIYQRGG